jgi:hypothetical protein
VSYGAKHYVIRALHVPYCRKLQLAEIHIEIGPKAQSNRRTKGARSAHEVLVYIYIYICDRYTTKTIHYVKYWIG